MTKERPILFSGAMVRAILDGRKTQTRRAVKPQPTSGLDGWDWSWPIPGKNVTPGTLDRWRDDAKNPLSPRYCPYGKPGDRLWVRETWRPRIVHSCFDMACDCETVWVDYPAGGEGQHFEGDSIPDEWYMPQAAIKGRSVPSLHMPRWASRLLLEITGVRVERLNDCSEADAAAEGLHILPASGRYVVNPGEQYFGAADHDPRVVYADLWDRINGDGAWEANPWVWVVEFRRIAA